MPVTNEDKIYSATSSLNSNDKFEEVVVDGKVIRQKVYYKVNDGYNKVIDEDRTLSSFRNNLEGLQHILDEIAYERHQDYNMLASAEELEMLSELAENE